MDLYWRESIVWLCVLATEAAVDDEARVAYGYIENEKDSQQAFGGCQPGEERRVGDADFFQIGQRLQQCIGGDYKGKRKSGIARIEGDTQQARQLCEHEEIAELDDELCCEQNAQRLVGKGCQVGGEDEIRCCGEEAEKRLKRLWNRLRTAVAVEDAGQCTAEAQEGNPEYDAPDAVRAELRCGHRGQCNTPVNEKISGIELLQIQVAQDVVPGEPQEKKRVANQGQIPELHGRLGREGLEVNRKLHECHEKGPGNTGQDGAAGNIGPDIPGVAQRLEQKREQEDGRCRAEEPVEGNKALEPEQPSGRAQSKYDRDRGKWNFTEHRISLISLQNNYYSVYYTSYSRAMKSFAYFFLLLTRLKRYKIYKILIFWRQYMVRTDGRTADEMRRVKITKHFQRYPAGSVLIEVGNTKVICAATIEERVPGFLKGSGEGWLTAEYSLLPSSTLTRTSRESMRGRVSGRTQEIQRLIGRSLRSVMDMKALGERTVMIDCDVLQADGGTRTASITGAYIALVQALATIYNPEKNFPVKDFLAAVSVGVSAAGEPIIDLCYEEDSQAIVDMNVVMTGSGAFVEVQGTGEGRPFSRQEMEALLAKAEKGIDALISYQKDILGGELVWKVGREM